MSKKNQDWAHLDEVPEEELSEVQRAIAAVERNPKQFALGALVIAVCILATLVFQMQTKKGLEAEGATYARAMDIEDENERLAALGAVAEDSNVWGVEALYMVGETAISARKFEDAKNAFERIRSEHGDHALAPQAVEALAFMAENSGDYKNALALYGEVEQRWQNSFQGQVQQFSVGRVKESMGDFAGAKAAYEDQVALMPDARLASRSKAALDRLAQDHPDLFPVVEEAVEAEVTTEVVVDGAVEVVEVEEAASE